MQHDYQTWKDPRELRLNGWWASSLNLQRGFTNKGRINRFLAAELELKPKYLNK
jgi:hypothetical protein